MHPDFVDFFHAVPSFPLFHASLRVIFIIAIFAGMRPYYSLNLVNIDDVSYN